MSTSPISPCPFCQIASLNPPTKPLLQTSSSPTPPTPSASSQSPIQPQYPSPEPTSHILLSTPTVLCLLDTMPLHRGHILLITRAHRQTLGELTASEGAILGAWMPILARALMKALGLDGEDVNGGYNVLQNNGVTAAQVIPHLHFHIIPRPPHSTVPKTQLERSFVMFGRGQREDLGDAEAGILAEGIRREICREVEILWRTVEQRKGGWVTKGTGKAAIEKIAVKEMVEVGEMGEKAVLAML